jgi:hypothetical protein
MEIAPDSPADVSEHEPADGQWMTLADLGRARGISKASAARLVRRHTWRRQAGNDGRVRVLVPPDAIEPKADSPGVSPADLLRAIRVLESATAAARERAAADATAIDALQAHLASETARGDALAAEVDNLRQADAERRARGRLARIRAAWRGE